MTDNAPVPRAAVPAAAMPIASNDGFRQAMLKTALETIPQLNEENYSIWKDKMTALLKLRGVLTALNDQNTPLGESDNAELTMLLLSKIDSVTHNNVVTAENSESAQKIWSSIKDRFASSQSSNRARMFNDFLYVKFQEDAVETFVTDIKVAIKKLVDVGIELPKDILAYLVLFKFPNSLQSLKRQIMHSDKDLSVEFVCNHLTQFNNEARAEMKESTSKATEAALFSSKGKSTKPSGNDRSDGPGQASGSKRCKSGYHNPKQDKNHSSDNCWHLHPDIAPEWWRESQAQWKASKEKDKTNYFMSLLTLWIESGDPKSRIILDSGASAHIFNDQKFFEHLELGDFDVIKTGKQDATLPIKGRGTVRLTWGNCSISLENCLFVPDIVINLISAGELDAKGCVLLAEKAKFSVSKEGRVALKGTIRNGLYSVNNPSSIGPQYPLVNLSSTKETLQETHEKFGHASIQRLEPLLDKSILRAEKDNFQCRSCILSKITKQPFKADSKLAERPFERLHLDLIGPIKPESSLKHRFILTVVDNHTGYLAGFPLVHKDDTTDVLIDLLEAEQRRRGYYPSLICSDGGGEFIGNSLNQIPRKGQTTSPWEILHNKPFPPDFLRPVGTHTITLNLTGVKGQKFETKGEEGRLLGFNVALQSYRVLTLSGRVIESKHVRFIKKEVANTNVDLDDETPLETEVPQLSNEHNPTLVERSPALDHRENTSDQEASDSSKEESSDDSEIENQLVNREPTPQPQEVTRTLRDRSLLKPPTRYGFHHYYEPNTFENQFN
ncbi:hypothetical protein VP01_982g8 [Puccinia sorghi]|uniref:Integrase catalytic domain-containing protein n=1 Tax=Puccinia sorghi TaxID=27349 RepID=A0A0L6U7P8_9BASI|nr:hypothetical protein VP01_982g8 [Puccinia sorghi]